MASIDAFKVRAVIEAGYDKNSLRRANNEISQSFAGMRNKMAKVQAVAASAQTSFMMVGASIAASFGAGVAAAASFEEQFVRVKKTLDVSGNARQVERAFEGISKRLRDLTKLSPVTTDVITEIAAVGGQLGVASKDIVSFTNTIQKLTIATNLSAENAAMAMSRLQEITGTQTSELDNLGSSLVALGNNFAAQESEITTAALQIATSTAQISGSMNNAAVDALAFSTALKAIGQPSQAGATAIVRLMTEMSEAVTEGGRNLQLFAKVSRMDVDSFVQLFGIDSTQAVAKFIEGLDSVNQLGMTNISVMSELGLGQVRTQKAILALAKAHDTLYDAIDTSNRAYIENNALNEEAERRYDTLFSELQKGRNLLKGEFIDFGLENLGTAKNLVKDLNDFLFGVVSNVTKFAKQISVVVGVLTVFRTVFNGASIAMKTMTNDAGLLAGTFERASQAAQLMAVSIAGGKGQGLMGASGEGLRGLQTFNRRTGQIGLPFNTLGPSGLAERLIPGRYDQRLMQTMAIPSLTSLIFGGNVPDDIAFSGSNFVKMQDEIKDLSTGTFQDDMFGALGVTEKTIEKIKHSHRLSHDAFMQFSEETIFGGFRRFKGTRPSQIYLKTLTQVTRAQNLMLRGVTKLTNKIPKFATEENLLNQALAAGNQRLANRIALQERLGKFISAARGKGTGFRAVLDNQISELYGDQAPTTRFGRFQMRRAALGGQLQGFNELVEGLRNTADETGKLTMEQLQFLDAVDKGQAGLGRFTAAIRGVARAIFKLGSIMAIMTLIFKTVQKFGEQARGIEEFNNKLRESAEALQEVADIQSKVLDINKTIADLQAQGAALSIVNQALAKQNDLLLQAENLRRKTATDIGSGFISDIIESSFGNNKGGILESLIPFIAESTDRSSDDVREALGLALGEVMLQAIDPENIARTAGRLPTINEIIENMLFSGKTFTNQQTGTTVKVPSGAFEGVSGGILMALQEELGSDVAGMDVIELIGLEEIFTPNKINELTSGITKAATNVAGGFAATVLKDFRKGEGGRFVGAYQEGIVQTMLAIDKVIGDQFTDEDLLEFAMDFVAAMATIQGATGQAIDNLKELDPNSPLAKNIQVFLKDRLNDFRDTGLVTQAEINRAGNNYKKLAMLYSTTYDAFQKANAQAAAQTNQQLNLSLSAQEKILKRMQDNFKQTRQSLLDLASPLPDDAFEGLSELEIFFNTVAKAAGQKELERITGLLRDFGNPVLATELAKGGPGSVKMAQTYLDNPMLAAAQEMQMRSILGPELAEEEFGIDAESQKELANQQGFDIGQNVAGGIIKGFTDSQEQLQDLLSGVLKGAILDGINWLGIKSPSRWMINNVGRPIIQGVMFGIEDGQPELERVFYDTLEKSFLNVPTPKVSDLTVSSSGVTVDMNKVANMIANMSDFASTFDFAVAYLKSLPLELGDVLSQMADMIAESNSKALSQMQKAFGLVTAITNAERAQVEQARSLVKAKQEYASVLRREATLTERITKVKEELNELELTGMKGNVDINERIGVLQKEIDLEERRRRLNKDFTAREQLDIQAKEREVAELGRMADLGVIDALEFEAASDELREMKGEFRTDREKELFLLEYASALDEKERYEKEILEISPALVSKREEYITLLDEQETISFDVIAANDGIAAAEERVAAGVLAVEAAFQEFKTQSPEYQKELEILTTSFDGVNDSVQAIIDSVAFITDPNNFDFSALRTNITGAVEDYGEALFVEDFVDPSMLDTGFANFNTMFNTQAAQAGIGTNTGASMMQYLTTAGGFNMNRMPQISEFVKGGGFASAAANINKYSQYFENPNLAIGRMAGPGGLPKGFGSTGATGNYADSFIDLVNAMGVGTTRAGGRVYFSTQNAEAIAKGLSADLAQAGLTPMEFEPYMQLLSKNQGNAYNPIYQGPGKNASYDDSLNEDGGSAATGGSGGPINYMGGRANPSRRYNTKNYGIISGGVLNAINDIVDGQISASNLSQDMIQILNQIDPNILKGSGRRVNPITNVSAFGPAYDPLGQFKYGGRVPDMTHIKPKKYAMGGRDNLMRRALVGEYGPEEVRFVPGSGFLVKPLTEGGRGNNTIVENLSVNVTGVPADPSSARKAAVEIRKALNRLDKEGNTGGGVARR